MLIIVPMYMSSTVLRPLGIQVFNLNIGIVFADQIGLNNTGDVE